MKKKSQMEIMGIAIVVIIISIVIVFFIRWGVLREPIQHKKEFAQSEIATNLVNTLLSTTSDYCKGLTFNELFQDCASTNSQICLGETQTTCVYVKGEVETVLLDTLGIWNYKYEFTVKSGDTNIIPAIGTCGDIKERKARTYPLPGGLEATLAICG